ncbi:MAG: bifunctional histidinol-phosphatase/imidazoleglycerol-phosphate dehydratase HisB [Bacteroidota bacterium]
MNVVFLDRDGTILVEPPDLQVDSLEKLEFLPGAFQGLRLLVQRGYRLVLVTNQDGLGSPSYPASAWDKVQKKMFRLLEGEGIHFAEVFVCPHGESDQCGCRKPRTGMVDEFLRRNPVNRMKSYVVGDRETDVQLGKAIGCKTVRLTSHASSSADILVPGILEACLAIVRRDRTASVRRTTRETDITADLLLDGTGESTVATGIGFFDHMLAQLARHSGIDLTIDAKGDLHIDEHHTVEDVGLAIGEAIRLALGDKRGIGRFGFAAPLDESLAQVVIDLSGRPSCSFRAKFERERVGELPTELVEDFFRAFADGLRSTMHVSVDGRNDHHKIEAVFKATARALKEAITLDPDRAAVLPTTKGML